MKRLGAVLLIFSVLAVLGSVFSPLLLAQENPGLNITVTPATIDLTGTPGSTVQQRIRLRNNTSNPVDFTVKTSKLAPDQNGDVKPIDGTDDYLSWISYTPSSFTAKPNEWTDIVAQVKIPTTAAFGYYYAIRITPTNAPVKKQNGSTLIGEALVPLLLTVKKDNAVADLQLLSFAPTQSLFEYLPTEFAVNLVNKGNIHIRPHGNIFIRTGSNADIAVLDINSGNGAMLPGQKRTYIASWDNAFLVRKPVMEDGVIKRDHNGKPETHLTINWNKLTEFRIGKYTAHLLAVYDNGTRDVPIEATTTFWVFPWKLLLGLLAVVVIGTFVLHTSLRWYVQREVKKHQNH